MAPENAMEGEEMEKIGSYTYRSSFYDKTAQTEKESGSAKTGATKSTSAKDGKTTSTLSAAAQKLLKELHNNYTNMDFIVADYETEEEAASLLSRGTSQYSALLTPEELEKMAADEDVKKENLKVLDDAMTKLDEMKGQLGDKADDVSRVGISIGKDGEVSFFAELEKNSERQRERIEKNREDKREAAKDAEKAEAEEKYKSMGRPAGKRTTVFASSVEELAKKIEQVDWSTVKEESYISAGHRFDFTV